MTVSKVEPLPVTNLLDVPAGLRALADQIEAGDYNAVWQLGWVLKTHDQPTLLSCGLLGSAEVVSAELHLLFALAQRRIELRVAPPVGVVT